MKKFWFFFDRVLDGMTVLAGVILVFICAGVCYTIGMRFLFTRTTIWIIPTTEYALLWIVFLATTWLLREGGHIITDIIHAYLNEKIKHYLDFLMFVIGGFACAMMSIFGMVYLYDCMINNVTDVRAVTVPKSAVFIIIPLGFILLTMQFFRMAWGRVIDMKAKR
ncbi:MAG: TRAP transporter small permease [Pseudomonadota bacterium]